MKVPFPHQVATTPHFEIERRKILRNAAILGAQICAVLVPLFGILDLIIKPHLFWTFFAIRLTVTCFCIIITMIAKIATGRKHPFILAASLALIVCGAISLMTVLDQGAADPYYAGINLPLLGFGILLPLTMGESLLVMILVWLSYMLPNAILIHPGQINIFISNNFFLISTIIISFISTQFNFQNTKKQYLARRRLQSAHLKIKNHAADLEKKVKERTQRLLQSERLAVVGQLAGGIAHDFNNVLTAILGTSQMILESLSQKNKLHDDIEIINRAGKKAADLVRQLLAFSRCQVLQPKVLCINDVVRDIGKMLQRLIGEDIDLIFITPPNLWNVLADPVQIEQIILNLSVNSRDAMPDGGKFVIETSNVTLDSAYCKLGKVSLPPGEYVMLSASDTGQGMTEQVRSKIFEPFFTTKERGKGTGLGLSTVYGIVKQSNGDIIVYSEPGKGTTLKIFFPRFMQKKAEYPAKPKITRMVPKGNETILLVEDEKEVRLLTARMLKNQGYQVMEAPGALDALTLSHNYNGQIHLLLTDIIMPQMNGKELANRIINERRDTKVLFISGHMDHIVDQDIHGTGFSFLQKPFTLETLNQKIRTLFDN